MTLIISLAILIGSAMAMYFAWRFGIRPVLEKNGIPPSKKRSFIMSGKPMMDDAIKLVEAAPRLGAFPASLKLFTASLFLMLAGFVGLLVELVIRVGRLMMSLFAGG